MYEAKKTQLTSPTEQGQTRWPSSALKAFSRYLELWRNSFSEFMKWKYSDPPSGGINVARLRAKYYGARYLIYQPFLYRAVHLMGQSMAPLVSNDFSAATGAAASGSKFHQACSSIPCSQSGTRTASPPPPNQTVIPAQSTQGAITARVRNMH